MNEYKLGDYLKAINDTKVDLMKDDPMWEKKYPPFIINRCLSMFWDTIESANHMNMNHHLDRKVQFHYLLNSIRKRKRFDKLLSHYKAKNLEYVKEYYGYSNDKAKQTLNILTKDQIEVIKKKLSKGGRK